MSPLFTLQKIVMATSQSEAQKIFRARKEQGISGVIFTPEIDVPAWTSEHRKRLSDTLYKVDAKNQDLHHITSPDWIEIGKPFADQLIVLSRGFNTAATSRKCRYLNQDDLAEASHRDLGAEDGWIHFHESGEGLLCANPIGDNPVQVKATGSYAENMDKEDMERLVAEGLIEWLLLQPRSAIAFDHNMVHKSAWGPRFRAVAYG